jgi:hypothetical protein
MWEGSKLSVRPRTSAISALDGVCKRPRSGRTIGEAPAGFVQTIAHGLIDKICGESHKDTLSISCEIRDNLGTGRWRGSPIGDGHLAVLFEAEQYGYVAVGAHVAKTNCDHFRYADIAGLMTGRA